MSRRRGRNRNRGRSNNNQKRQQQSKPAIASAPMRAPVSSAGPTTTPPPPNVSTPAILADARVKGPPNRRFVPGLLGFINGIPVYGGGVMARRRLCIVLPK